MVKMFDTYVVGEIISVRGRRYEVALKTVKKWFSKGAGHNFYTNLLYLRALDSIDNRIGVVSQRGILTFEKKPIWGSRALMDAYTSWQILPVINQ